MSIMPESHNQEKLLEYMQKYRNNSEILSSWELLSVSAAENGVYRFEAEHIEDGCRGILTVHAFPADMQACIREGSEQDRTYEAEYMSCLRKIREYGESNLVLVEDVEYAFDDEEGNICIHRLVIYVDWCMFALYARKEELQHDQEEVMRIDALESAFIEDDDCVAQHLIPEMKDEEGVISEPISQERGVDGSRSAFVFARMTVEEDEHAALEAKGMLPAPSWEDELIAQWNGKPVPAAQKTNPSGQKTEPKTQQNASQKAEKTSGGHGILKLLLAVALLCLALLVAQRIGIFKNIAFFRAAQNKSSVATEQTETVAQEKEQEDVNLQNIQKAELTQALKAETTAPSEREEKVTEKSEEKVTEKPKEKATPTPKKKATPTPKKEVVPTVTPTAMVTAVPTPVPTVQSEMIIAVAPTPVTLESLGKDYPIQKADTVSFYKRRSVPVYTGPGKNYLRAGRGKAEVVTNSHVICYGRYGDWYLVEYGVNHSQNRRGYISKESISGFADINKTPIIYAGVKAYTTGKTDITDDPGNGRKAICSLDRGAEVTVLFIDGEWVCIETKESSAGLVQGYIPMDVVEIDERINVPLLPTPVPQSEAYVPRKNEQLVLDGVEASTYINGSKMAYKADLLIDGKETSSWQFRTTRVDSLRDVYVDFELEQSSCVTQLWIKNGSWNATQGYEQYSRNGRLHRLEISFRYDGTDVFLNPVIAELKDEDDRSDWTKVDLGVHTNVIEVRVRVLDIYQGTEFKEDVAVSEMRIVGERMRSDTRGASAAGAVSGTLLNNKVNLRKGPSKKERSKGMLYINQEVTVLGQVESEGALWYKIDANGEDGYVMASMVSVPAGSVIPVIWK